MADNDKNQANQLRDLARRLRACRTAVDAQELATELDRIIGELPGEPRFGNIPL